MTLQGSELNIPIPFLPTEHCTKVPLILLLLYINLYDSATLQNTKILRIMYVLTK